MPVGGKVKVEVISSHAAISSRISLEIRQPEYIMLCEYANKNIGFTWTSDEYDENTPVEFGIDWYMNDWGIIYEGKEAGVITTQISDYEYTMGFEARGDDWNYNEIVIRVNIIPSELVVLIDPAVIFSGDTTNVIIKKRLTDGTLVDYPTEQTFEIGMLEGCILGKINAEGIDTNYICGAHQPIYFIADTAFYDSGKVLLRVGLIEETTLNKFDAQIDETSEYCFTMNFISSKYKDVDVVVDNPLVIIYPTPDTTEWITEEPQMPTVICKAKLKNYDSGLINFEWEYWVRYTLYRHAYYTSTELCERTGMIKITGFSDAYNSDTTSWEVSFKKLNLDSAEFKAMQPQIPGKSTYGGNCDEIRNSWTEGEDIFIGGYVFVQVTAKNSSGQIIGFKQLNAGKLLGKNPTSQVIQNYAGTGELNAIIYHESLTGNERWKQFNPQDIDLYYSTFGYLLYGWKYNKRGYPGYGVPNGYGLAKIDNPPPIEMDLWNWKHNVDTGRKRLLLAKANSNTYITSSGAVYEEEKFWMNAFQMYNGGRYWNWIDDKRAWIENPSRPNNNYGKLIYQIYQSIN